MLTVRQHALRVEFALEAVALLVRERSETTAQAWARLQDVAALRGELQVAFVTADAEAVSGLAEITASALWALGVDPARIPEYFGNPTAQA